MAQTGAFLVMAVIITVYMTSNGRRLSMFGFLGGINTDL
jgi:hypothetical protein